jgi:hypothetical protein
MEAAAEAWGGFSAEFDREPIVARVVVQPEGDLAPEPSHRAQGHLMSIVSDPHNFVVLDLQALFGYAFVSEKTVADHTWLRWFFLEPMALVLLTQRYLVPLHSACVAKNGRAILLCGISGAGKSTLAFACARAGWTFVSDDVSWMVPGSADLTVLGKPHQARLRHDAPRFFPELEGYITRARPNGKLSIEVPTAEFPEIQTAMRGRLGAVVFLRRREAGAAHLQRLSSHQVWEELMVEGACAPYGDEVGARHVAERRRLLELPGYYLEYSDLGGAIGQLSKLAADMKD